MTEPADPTNTTTESAAPHESLPSGSSVGCGPLPPAATHPGAVPVPPPHLGRYQVQRLLGQGEFGQVYLGWDDELQRPVAVKVAHRHRVAEPQDVEAYLTEARVLASMDHPHIVPVYDVGRTDDWLPFVVSKFIEGTDLAGKGKEERPSFTESAGRTT